MAFNIQHAEGGADCIIDLVRREGPDVLCLQEAGRGRSDDVAAQISESLGGYDVVSAATLDLPAEQSCDVAILSRIELVETKAHSLNPGGWVYAISGRVNARGRPLRIFSVHLHASFKLDVRHLIESSSTRRKQVAALGDQIRAADGDVIVAGDFNFTQGMREYSALRQGLVDFGSNGPEAHSTYPATSPLLRLDYIFGAGRLKTEEYRVLESTCSDHRPVAARLRRDAEGPSPDL